ncbi:MAG: three component ABC system middle component [Campylobacterota bacterium]
MKFEQYNNIGFSLMSFLSIIKNMNSLEYSKSLLILPLVLHDPLVKYLKDGRVVIRGIEDLILSKVEYFLNYNDRYFNYLPLSLNTIIFAEKMGYIEINNSQIIPIKQEIEKINFSVKELGSRINTVYKASNNIVKILDEDVKELYFKLRIEI